MSAGESSWRKALEYGLRFAFYAILWVIIGVLLINYGMSLLGEAEKLASTPYPYPEPDVGRLEAYGFFSILFGLIILMMGIATSFFKVVLDLIRDAIPKPVPPPQQA